MTYEQLKHLKPSALKRKCGDRGETFEANIWTTASTPGENLNANITVG